MRCVHFDQTAANVIDSIMIDSIRQYGPNNPAALKAPPPSTRISPRHPRYLNIHHGDKVVHCVYNDPHDFPFIPTSTFRPCRELPRGACDVCYCKAMFQTLGEELIAVLCRSILGLDWRYSWGNLSSNLLDAWLDMVMTSGAADTRS